ncbi:MAG: hypothetical protein ABIR70_13320 [Bryobacteraceae bacterium]
MSTRNKSISGQTYIVVGSGTKKVKFWCGGLAFVWLGEKGSGIGWFNCPVMF